MNKITKFKKIVRDFYKKNKRQMDWRETKDPYKILISEVMLQQTQVERIKKKYPAFIKRFSSFKSLANASLTEVLKYWQGIGYNRRAKYLKELAEIVVQKYKGKLPNNPLLLDELPGIGKATAASIAIYAFNKPFYFIDTNVRRVFIHYFFQDEKEVSDKDIEPLVIRTLDKDNPREWFYALMDYGSYLGKLINNPNKKSKHYTKQSKFEGSVRQLRGEVLKRVIRDIEVQENILYTISDDRILVEQAIRGLMRDGIIKEKKGSYTIT